jgi:ABC-type sugar transport system ATPase subunit
MTAIAFRGLTKTFGDFTAVDSFWLDVADGEFVVLVGPSGCGKTTSLRMLAGLTPPTGGEIWLGERDITRVDAKDRNIAMVFQTYALYPHMSVFDNVSFALKLRRRSKGDIEAAVRRAAGLMGIEHLLERRPRELSGGQRQRVAVCRAIVRDPEAFLFDEPLSNLDAKLRTTARAEIRKLQQQLGVTTVYVTHDQVEAMTMADRIVVMNDAVVQQVGPPLDIYAKPANTFVASFIGAPPMNLIPADATDDGSGGFLVQSGNIAFAAAGVAPGPLALGFRAEDVVLAGDACRAPVRFRARVIYFEALGSETLLHLETEAGPIQSRIPGRIAVSNGESLDFFIDADNWHLFGADGARIEDWVPQVPSAAQRTRATTAA